MAIIPASGEVNDAVRDDSYMRIASSIESAYCKNNAQAFVFAPVGSAGDALPTIQAVRQQLVAMGYNPLLMRAEDLLQGHKKTNPMARPKQQAEGMLFNETVSEAQLRWMRSSHDMVFIEAQPMRMSAASEYAARSADAVLLVCESSTTQKAELTDAVLLLERLEVPTVGILLDNLVLSNADSVERRHLKAAHKAVATPEIHYRTKSDRSLVTLQAKA